MLGNLYETWGVIKIGGMGYRDKLQRLCALKGIDQAALAERCGVSKSTISRILSGVQEPKLRLAYDLARALGVTLDYLVEESQEVDPSVQLVPVTADEQTILKIVRRLGTDVAIDRLLGVERPPTSEAAGGRGPASEAKGQGGREQNGDPAR